MSAQLVTAEERNLIAEDGYFFEKNREIVPRRKVFCRVASYLSHLAAETHKAHLLLLEVPFGKQILQ